MAVLPVPVGGDPVVSFVDLALAPDGKGGVSEKGK